MFYKEFYQQANQHIRSRNDVDALYQQSSETVSEGPYSEVRYVTKDDKAYYIKYYHKAGKGWRRLFGHSRAYKEWHNLRYFAKLGIPTAPIVAFYEAYQFGRPKKSVLVTEAIPNTSDLAQLATEQPQLVQNREWLAHVMQQLADHLRLLHLHHFVHRDIHWRNVLVSATTKPTLYFIDCPLSHKRYWPFYRYGVVRDLFLLNRGGSRIPKDILSRTQKLKFYLHYLHQAKLTQQAKRLLRQIVRYNKRKCSR